MFAYDANKQAHIADINAGTYRELVEAAESSQVSIIHPGKPRNPNEPGIAELLGRLFVGDLEHHDLVLRCQELRLGHPDQRLKVCSHDRASLRSEKHMKRTPAFAEVVSRKRA